jgi:pilus assembly protein CpaD
MTMHRIPVALALAIALLPGACAPISTYSAAEAPKRLTLDTSDTRVDLRFAPGSARLIPADAAQLAHLAATGSIGSADRVTVATAGAPALAEQRLGAVARVLLPYGVVVAPGRLAAMQPDHAVVEVDRTLVTLPPCPNWSKSPSYDYSNSPSSNFGCATETNLGLMVASPSDLASGRPSGSFPAQPETSAMARYLTDKVELPSANTALPVSQQSSSSSGNSGSPATGTGTGTGGP